MQTDLDISSASVDTRSSALHYENDVAFFCQFLDPYLKYGSGYFEPDDSFERASVRMLDRAIDASGVLTRRDPRVLDVGSGWGSLFRRLGERAPAAEYHHVNPSTFQRGFIERSIGRAAWTHGGGLESAPLAAGAYDAIFVHDSYCHLADKGEMLKRLARALRPDGRVVLQDTFFATDEGWVRHRNARTTRFIQRDVFGFADIRPVAGLATDASAAALRLVRLEDVSDHYKRTAAAWLSRLGTVHAQRFPQRDATARMIRRGASCMGYSTTHYFAVLAPMEPSHRSLRETLVRLRGSERGNAAVPG